MNLNMEEDAVDNIMFTVIHYEDISYLQLLLKAEIRVVYIDDRDISGSTALKCAIVKDDLKVIKMLLEAGADPNHTNYSGQTPLEVACISKPEVLQLLIEYARKTYLPPLDQDDLLEKAAGAPYANACRNVDLLLNEGIRADTPTYFGRRPIDTAIVRQNDNVLQLLIKHGANLETPSRNGDRALHLAIEYATIRAVEIILEQTVEINAQNRQNETPLTIAFKVDVHRKMEMLLQDGALLYPPGINVSYINPEGIPWLTPALYIPLLAKDTVEGRIVRIADIHALETFHPTFDENFKIACLEWQRIINTYIVEKLSFKDLLDKPTQSLLHISRTVEFRQQEKIIQHHVFPTYGLAIAQAIQKLVQRRDIWEDHEENVHKATVGHLPDLIIECIAYYMSLE